jgi:hypothetical protein
MQENGAGYTHVVKVSIDSFNKSDQIQRCAVCGSEREVTVTQDTELAYISEDHSHYEIFKEFANRAEYVNGSLGRRQCGVISVFRMYITGACFHGGGKYCFLRTALNNFVMNVIAVLVGFISALFETLLRSVNLPASIPLMAT